MNGDPAPLYRGEAQHVAVRSAVARIVASHDDVIVLGSGLQRVAATVTGVLVSTTHIVIDGEHCRAASIRIRPPSAPESAQELSWLPDGLRAAGWVVIDSDGEWAVLGSDVDQYLRSRIAKRAAANDRKAAALERVAECNSEMERLAPLLGGRLVKLAPDRPHHIVLDYSAAKAIAERLCLP